MVKAKTAVKEVEAEVETAKKAKYDVLMLPVVMVKAGGASRLERIKNAVNSIGDIKGVLTFKGETYVIAEK